MWKPYQRFTDQVLILANKVDGNLSNLWLWRLFGSGVVFEDDVTANTGVVMIFSIHSMKLFTGRSAASVCFTPTVHRQLLILKLFYCVKIKYAIMNKILYVWPGIRCSWFSVYLDQSFEVHKPSLLSSLFIIKQKSFTLVRVHQVMTKSACVGYP